MKQTTIRVLDDRDLEFIEALRNLNVSRKLASLITYLASIPEASSREIEVGTSLQQPEVSTAMRTLRRNNWVEEHDIKKERKGRPMKVYKLSVPLDSIIQHYEEERKQESSQAMISIQRLRELSTA
jgi:predicted transcriptional regulator